MFIIAVIDRHPLVRKGLVIFLQERIQDAAIIESDSFDEIREGRSEPIPDLIILGSNVFPDPNPLSPVSKTIRTYPTGRFILYDDEYSDFTKITAYLKVGVSGYSSKKDNLQDLVACIQSVMDGKRIVIYDEKKQGLAENSNQNKISKYTQLTPAEYEIAKYLSQGIKASLIAGILKRHISSIRQIKSRIFFKLNVKSIESLAVALQKPGIKRSVR